MGCKLGGCTASFFATRLGMWQWESPIIVDNTA